MPSGIAMRLRAETRSVHERLETDLDLLAHSMTPDRYRRLLERFLGFHAELEPRLDDWHAADPRLDWPERRKVPGLLGDLDRLGVPPGALQRVARCPDVPEVAGAADALGALYVVEGATLGGALIARHLHTQQQIPPDALAFFGSSGADVGRRWRRWRRVTEEWVGSDGTRADAVVAQALRTFTSLERWLRPVGRRAAA
jgi:heme oxygenase